MDIERVETAGEPSEGQGPGLRGRFGWKTVTGALMTVAVAVFGLMAMGPTEVEQPVEYPHASHVSLGMECESCHTGAITGVHAGIPPTDTCRLCHRKDHAFPKSPPALIPYLESSEEIPWKQLHRMERHVYFSHNRHVTLAAIECAECHGEVEHMVEPFTATAFENERPGMDRCVDCHLEEQVTTDCHSCHR